MQTDKNIFGGYKNLHTLLHSAQISHLFRHLLYTTICKLFHIRQYRVAAA